MTYYHLRITFFPEENYVEVNQPIAATMASNFGTKFDHLITKAVFGYEFINTAFGKIQNHHIHGHIEYKENITTQELDKIKYYLKTKHAHNYNHQPLKKEPRNNELYVTKDCRVVHKIRYTEEELKSISQENLEIEEDKKKDPKLKLIEIIKQKHGSILKLSMNRLLEEIKEVYILKWDKMPPPQCRAYTEYIAVKEIAEYMKAPRMKKDPLGDLPDEIILPPLANSYNDHCAAQYPHDKYDYDYAEWE